MDPNYIPAIITASVALIAAILAQILNNILTNKREQKKYYKDIYGNLIANKLNQFIEYSYIIKNPITEEEENENTNLGAIIDGFEGDIQYFNSRLQLNYSYYKVNRYIDGSSENLEKRLQFEIAFFFIMYAKEVIKRAKLKTDENYDSLLHSVASTYAYLAIGTNFENAEFARNNVIALTKAFDSTLEENSLERYEDILLNDYKYPAEAIMNKVNSKIHELYM